MRVVLDTAGWADAIAAMPATGPLPTRTVIVWHERTAHALRRELLRTGRSWALAGTRFVSMIDAATAVLAEEGVAIHLVGPPQRVAAIAGAIAIATEGDLALEHFGLAALRGAGGWDRAFASAIDDLEQAGLRPEDLRRQTSAQLRDIAAVWTAAESLAPDAWSPARVLREAASALAKSSAAWTFDHPAGRSASVDGPTLVTLPPWFTAVEARFACALPTAELALFAARPAGAAYVDRVSALLGAPAAELLRRHGFKANASSSEREILATNLFAPSVAGAARPRSSGPDGSVALEQHAGVEAEVQAAVDWVARQLLDHRAPLGDVALLVPQRDPWVGLLHQQLLRLDPAVAVHVSGGAPLASAAGARVLVVLRALGANLPADFIAELLPLLRPPNDETRRLTRRRARSLAYALGTVGGSGAQPAGALTWSAGVARSIQRAEAAEQQGAADAGDPAQRALADLRWIAPAIDDLCAISARTLANAPLRQIWPLVEAFLGQWVVLPITEMGPLVALLAQQAAAIADDPLLGDRRGGAAISLLEDLVRDLRAPSARYGGPAVYLGTIQGAVGLSFEAVRVLGLSEGHWPATPREDPVLPDGLRATLASPRVRSATLPEAGLSRAGDRSLAQLQALACVVRGARREVVLSMPRADADGSQREPSAVFLEAAAALGRPSADAGAVPGCPSLHQLRLDGFVPARRALERHRRAWPVSAPAWASAVARGAPPPGSWRASPGLDVARLRAALRSGARDPAEGLLGDGFALELPGESPERPISASGLHDLLRCPHRFLLQRVLGWREVEDAGPTRAVDPMSYGSLFHGFAERFFDAHGAAFSARRRTLEGWQAEARALAADVFDAFLETYPLVGTGARDNELARVHRDVARLIDAEWRTTPPTVFVAAEHAFGYDAPERIQAAGVELYVRGFIDRIDVEGDRLIVRDFKTGRGHPRRGAEQPPVALVDLQIGVYALVARRIADARELGLAAAYVYTGLQADRERAFRDDIHALEAAATSWLATASAVLRERVFVRTPDPADCRYCAFSVVCGDDFHAGVAEMLEPARGGARRALHVLKLSEET